MKDFFQPKNITGRSEQQKIHNKQKIDSYLEKARTCSSFFIHSNMLLITNEIFTASKFFSKIKTIIEENLVDKKVFANQNYWDINYDEVTYELSFYTIRTWEYYAFVEHPKLISKGSCAFIIEVVKIIKDNEIPYYYILTNDLGMFEKFLDQYLKL